jgi:hypothetical protein
MCTLIVHEKGFPIINDQIYFKYKINYNCVRNKVTSFDVYTYSTRKGRYRR